jgi:hypothetical protein
MTDSEFAKTYVRPDNTAVLICPYCAQWKKISAEPYRGDKHKFTVACFCKKTFKVFLEFRKKVRKKRLLKGSYINHSQNSCRSDIVILDISVIGLAFSSVNEPTFNIGDDLSVEFILDNGPRTNISRDAIVRNVVQTRAGCEFKITDGGFYGPLGFYLMS